MFNVLTPFMFSDRLSGRHNCSSGGVTPQHAYILKFEINGMKGKRNDLCYGKANVYMDELLAVSLRWIGKMDKAEVGEID